MTRYFTVISLALLVTYDAATSALPEQRPYRVLRQAGDRACQCLLGAAAEDVVSDMQPLTSFAAPDARAPQPCVQAAQPAEDPPKLFEPEVDFLSSVLGTLHKVSDHNYKQAAAKEITEETNRLREAVAFKDGLLKASSKLTREHLELPKLPNVLDKLGGLKYRADDYVPDISRSTKIGSALRGSDSSNAHVMDSEPSASDDAPIYSREKPRLSPLQSALLRKPSTKLKSTHDIDTSAPETSPAEPNSKALLQENKLNKIKSFLSSKRREKESAADSETLQSMSPDMSDQIIAAIRRTLSGTTNTYRCRIIFE